VEAEDTAATAFGFGDEERGFIGWGCGRFVGEQRGEVVVEGEDGLVVGVVDAAGAGVGGAEVAGGIVVEAAGGGLFGGLALPGALGALRGDEDPLAEERVVAAVGDEVEWAWRGGHELVLGAGDLLPVQV
jgi:hypothetical protein